METDNDGQRRTVTWGGGKDKTDNERRGGWRQTMTETDNDTAIEKGGEWGGRGGGGVKEMKTENCRT